MSTQPIDSLSKKIINRYNKQPVGWSILRDLKGNVLIVGPKKGYMLKVITINPQEYTGVGMEIENPNDIRTLLKGAPQYGYRPLRKGQAKELLNSFQQSQTHNTNPQDKSPRGLTDQLGTNTTGSNYNTNNEI